VDRLKRVNTGAKTPYCERIGIEARNLDETYGGSIMTPGEPPDRSDGSAGERHVVWGRGLQQFHAAGLCQGMGFTDEDLGRP
jgi:hypothetical protein